MKSETTVPSWVVTAEKVEEAIRRIVEVSRPRMVIVFGSYVSGTLNWNSDLDVLVVTEDAVTNPREESVRIRLALREIRMPMDIVVVPWSQWEQFKDTPGLIYREARRTGKVVYESAQAA